MGFVFDVLFIWLWIAFAYLIWSQILYPLCTGRHMFPMFKAELREVSSTITDIRDYNYEQGLQEVLSQLEQEQEERRKAKAQQEGIATVAADQMLTDPTDLHREE